MGCNGNWIRGRNRRMLYLIGNVSDTIRVLCIDGSTSCGVGAQTLIIAKATEHSHNVYSFVKRYSIGIYQEIMFDVVGN